jgi:PAS domain S-box-containing protein
MIDISEEHPIAEKTPNPVAMVSKDGTLISSNGEAGRILRTLGCEVGSQVPECILCSIPEALESGTSDTIELNCGGEAVQFTIVALPGKPLGPSSESHEFKGPAEANSPFLNSLPMAFYSTKVSGDFEVTWISDGITPITGSMPHQFLRSERLWGPSIHPDDRKRVEQAINGLTSTGQMSIEYRRKRADGNYKWVLDHAYMICAPGKEPLVAGTMMDIDLRKQLERSLMDHNEFLGYLVDGLSEGIVVLDETAHILYLNPFMRRALGLKVQQWLRGLVELPIDPRDANRTMEAFGKALRGNPASCSACLRTAGGGGGRYRLSLSRMEWQGKNCVLGVVIRDRQNEEVRRLKSEKADMKRLLTKVHRMLARGTPKDTVINTIHKGLCAIGQPESAPKVGQK